MEAPGEDRSIALAMANSRRRLPRETVDDLQTVEDLRRRLSLHRLEIRSTPLATAQLRQLVTLRDCVRELLCARVENRRVRAAHYYERTRTASDSTASAAQP